VRIPPIIGHAIENVRRRYRGGSLLACARESNKRADQDRYKVC
jgi:hypothetical protein